MVESEIETPEDNNKRIHSFDSISPSVTKQKNYNVSEQKILRWKDEVDKTDNYVVRILHIYNCKNLNEALNYILKFDFEIYSNIFVIIFEIKIRLDLIALNAFEEKVFNKINGSRPLLLEMKFSERPRIYYLKRRNSKKFEIFDFLRNVSEKTNTNCLKAKLKDYVVNCDALLLILNCPLLTADYTKILTYFKSSEESVEIRAANSGDELSLLLLHLFDAQFDPQSEIKMLFSIIKLKKIELFFAYFNFIDQSQITDVQMEEIFKLEDNGDNIFIAAIKSKSSKILQFLTTYCSKFKDFFSVELFKEACTIALKSESFESFNELKNFNFDTDDKNAIIRKTELAEGKKIIKKISSLHQSIKNGHFSEVKIFVRDFPNLKLCYGNDSSCALEWSITCEKFEIYAYLRANGFYSDNGKALDDKIMKLEDKQKETIRKEILKYVIEGSDAYFGIILTNCKFTPQSPMQSNDAFEMLLIMKNIDTINSILPSIALWNVSFFMDFKNITVCEMDPFCCGNTYGVSYNKYRRCYVGLNTSKNQRYGTFAHELTHVGLDLLYENDSLPYCKWDKERESEFTKIVNDLKSQLKKNQINKIDTEKIIEWVFRYGENKWNIEMAVRVNDILAYYHDNQEKIESLKENHKALFNFCENLMNSDFKIKNIHRMIKLNKDFELIESLLNSPFQIQNIHEIKEYSKRVIFCSNVPQLAALKLYENIKNCPSDNQLNLKGQNLFVDAEKLEQDIFFDEFDKMIESGVVKTVIFKFKSKLEIKKLNFINFLNENEGIQAFFVVGKNYNVESINLDVLNFESFEIVFEWNDLSESSKTQILKQTIKFQGELLEISQVLENCEDIELLSALCSDPKVSINCVESFLNQFIIPRKITMKLEIDGKLEYLNLNLNDFLKEIQNERIVVITGESGSGITTLLWKIREHFSSIIKSTWISLKNLRKIDKKIFDCGEVVEQMIKILKLDEINAKVFTEKFKMGEVKVLFDGFDEVSQDTQIKFMNFLNIFNLEVENRNQILIATRPHEELYVENTLKIFSHRIMHLEIDEQKNLLVKIWLANNPNADVGSLEGCAELLIKKVNNSTFLGLPSNIQWLAVYFNDKINGNMEQFILTCKIFEIFDGLFNNIIDEKAKRNDKNHRDFINKPVSLVRAHQHLAIIHIFDGLLASNLGLSSDEWSSEEFQRYGIVYLDHNKIFCFNDETIAEFLVIKFLFESLRGNKETFTVKYELFVKILLKKELKFARILLNENIHEYSFSSKYVFETVNNEDNILCHTASENHVNVFVCVLHLIKTQGDKSYDKIMARCKTCFLEILLKVNTEDEIKKILDEILSNDNTAKALLNYIDKEGDSLLSVIVTNGFKSNLTSLIDVIHSESEIKGLLLKKYGIQKRCLINLAITSNINIDLIEDLWTLFEKILGVEHILNTFNELSILSHTLKSSKTPCNFKFLWKKIEELNGNDLKLKEVIKEVDVDGENYLHRIIREGSIPMLEFFLKEIKFEDNEKLDYLKTKNNFGFNLFHIASQNNNESILNSLTELITTIDINLVNYFLEESDNRGCLPIHYAIEWCSENSLILLIKKYEENFDNEQITQFLNKAVNNKNIIEHSARVKNEMLKVVKDFLELYEYKFFNKT